MIIEDVQYSNLFNSIVYVYHESLNIKSCVFFAFCIISVFIYSLLLFSLKSVLLLL